MCALYIDIHSIAETTVEGEIVYFHVADLAFVLVYMLFSFNVV